MNITTFFALATLVTATLMTATAYASDAERYSRVVAVADEPTAVQVARELRSNGCSHAFWTAQNGPYAVVCPVAR